MKFSSRAWCFASVFFWVSLSISDASAAENYLLFPVTTDLQRLLTFPNAQAYVEINAAATIKDKQFDPALLDAHSLRRDLEKLAKQSSDSIQVCFRFENWSGNDQLRKELEETATSVCREVGFKTVVTSQRYVGGGWDEKKRISMSHPDSPSGEESAIKDNLVTVYPVRTQLSRILSESADCLVCIRRPFDGREDEPSEQTQRAVAEKLEKLNLPQKKVIHFQISSTDGGAKHVKQFLSSEQGAPSGATRLAKRLGFESGTWTHSSDGGNPEKLIGQRAPDFSLDKLGGGKIELHAHLGGRAAIITFWGLACGPCRREAPHLTALYEKYRNEKFTIVAINAYDDDEQAVAEYVQKDSIRHPIALQGREVSREHFRVGAYPTTFWIDSNGIVVDYDVGFGEGEQVYIAKKVERLLQSTKATGTDRVR